MNLNLLLIFHLLLSYPYVLGQSYVQNQILNEIDNLSSDEFGYAVAVEGNLAAVGAPYANSATNTQQGTVSMFIENSGSWSLLQTILAADGAAGDNFGCALSMSGINIVIGAQGCASGSSVFTGAAYVYQFNGGAWVFSQKLTASDYAANNYFGFAVSVSGNVMAIGAYGVTGTAAHQGAVYIFLQLPGKKID